MTRHKAVSKILEVKEFTREQLEAEAKKAQAHLNAEQDKLNGLEESFKNTSVELMSKQTRGTMPVHECELFTTYLKHLGRLIDQQKRIVAIRTAELEVKQKMMVEAYREHRLIEILRDKIAQDEAKDAAHDEQKEADYQYLTRKAER